MKRHSLEPAVSRLEKFQLYETKPYFYLVGFDELETQFRVIKINRSIAKPKELGEIIQEDPLVYSSDEIVGVLEMINEGNKNCGGLKKLCTAYGIVGFVKFLNGYYLTLVTQRKEVGCIGGNFIYSIKATENFPIKPRDEPETNAFKMLWKKLNKKLSQTASEIAENRYLGLFQFIDMTKDFFFSYTYDTTHSLQFNYIVTKKTDCIANPQEMFEWNHYQIDEFRQLLGEASAWQWTMPIIHGSFQQKRFSILGRSIDMILIARRSRHYAGTRYLKRGLSVHGKVANDCEVEQILQYDEGIDSKYCSYVQMRGSIPTYWYQETSVTMPKPPILINRVDPDYLATQEHFTDMFRRYGTPVIVLDLVKQHEKRPRESIVGREFRQAIEVLNESIISHHKIRYLALDYSKITTISKGKLSKVKNNKQGFFGKDKDKERAMAAVGDEWAMMEKSLANTTADPAASKMKDSNILTNFDEAKKDFNLNNNQNSQNVPKLPGGFENIADVNAVESKIDVLRELEDIAQVTLLETGFFCNTLQYLDRVDHLLPNHSKSRIASDRLLVQNGVLRTNCIDCLDRTNGGQFAVAMRFLLFSLQALGLVNHSIHSADLSKNPLLLSLMEMYGEMGDKIALQYGGSEAHKKVFAGKSVQTKQSTSKQSELLTSIKRYYSNAFTDMVKQDAMNLFLGCFIPSESSIPLWDLESDYSLHNLSLHPPQSAIYKVLYEEVMQDSRKLKDPNVKSVIEQYIKKAIADARSAYGISPSLKAIAPVSDNASIASDTVVDLPENDVLLLSSLPKIIPEELENLARKYYIKLTSNSNSSASTSGEMVIGGSLLRQLRSVLIKLKHKGVFSSTIRTLTRLERRKLMRVLAARKIASSSESWWQQALGYYYNAFEGFSKDLIITEDIVPLENHSFFNRYYVPNSLTEFDNILSMDFFAPTEAAENPPESAVVVSKKHGNVRVRTSSSDLEDADGERKETANDEDDTGCAGGGNNVSNGLASLFFFYPTLTSPEHEHGDELARHENKEAEGKMVVSNADSNIPPPPPTANPATAGGFHIGKYVREFGMKARTIVGGLLGKDERPANNMSSQKNARGIASSVYQASKLNSQISMINHFIPKTSSVLYKKYQQIAQNHLLLMEEKKNQRIVVEEEYKMLLKDCTVDVDNVRGMENLAADGYISHQIKRGIFSGLYQTSSAILAYGFLFVSIVNIEEELEAYGSVVDQKAQAARDAAFNGVKALSVAVVEAVPKSLSFETNDPTQATRKHGGVSGNDIQDRIMKSILRSRVAHGLEIELKKNVNNYIFQQYNYSKEISLDRLERRMSPLTSERTILQYAAQFDFDPLARAWDEVTYIATSNPHYSSFRDMINLQQALEPLRKTLLENKKRVLQELEEKIEKIPAVAVESEKKSVAIVCHVKQPTVEQLAKDKVLTTISAQLGIHVDGLLEDLQTDYSLATFGADGYPEYPYNQVHDEQKWHWEKNYQGFLQLAPDVYSRLTNPHMQMNEVGVLSFQNALKSRQ